jgi:calcineurin-like phosphoesterase family protein
MRILVASDLHYNIKRSIDPTRNLAQRVRQRGGDVLILAGDIAGVDESVFTEALDLFSDFKGEKMLVAGNHDLWVAPGDNSYEKWFKRLPKLAQNSGFSMLDHAPKMSGHIGFVGNIGWYDYSFRDTRLNVPMRFYQSKIGPGRARRLAEWEHLVDSVCDLHPNHYEITSAWRDGDFVRLPMTDEDFTSHLAQKLQTDLSYISPKCDKIVAVLHHLPRRELVWYRGDPNWDFVTAFLGSRCFGDILRTVDNLSLCLSGHNHRSSVVKDGSVEYITLGSTYLEKVLLEYDL